MFLQRSSKLTLALLLAATSALAASSPVVAQTPPDGYARPHAGTANELRPLIMEEAAKLAAMPASSSLPDTVAPEPLLGPRVLANSALRREVFGFVNAGNLGSSAVGYPTWNFGLLSTVAYFGLQVNSGDGALVQGNTGWNVYHSATMGNFVRTANAAGTRVIVSLDLHDFSGSPTNQVCQGLTSTNAAATINQIVGQMKAAGVQGINVDYEGVNTTCANGQTSRAQLVTFTKNLRAAMTAALPQSYLAIDTYSGSAEDNLEFFDISGLAPYVDSFFVMAYDMDNDNWHYAPLNCATYCMNPVAALNTYRWNDTLSMAQYTALVPASKVILGVPYYGMKSCVANLTDAHQGIDNSQAAWNSGRSAQPTYLYAVSVPTDTGVSNFNGHRDPSDLSSRWDTWYSTDFACNREQYWDDVGALGAKYDLINRNNLAGAGLFALDYGGGAQELWNTLATHFTLIPSAPMSVAACPGDGFAVVSWGPAGSSGGPITGYTVTPAPSAAAVNTGPRAGSVAVPGLTNGTAYTFNVTASNQYGAGQALASNSITPGPSAQAWPGQLNPLSPGRLLDTRSGQGGFRTLAPGQTIDLPVLGKGGVPATGVAAVILNVTATNPQGVGYITAFPGGGCRPIASNLNFSPDGGTVASLAETAVGASGTVSLFNGSAGTVELVVDVEAWIANAGTSGGAGRFQPTPPARIADTRISNGISTLAPHQAVTLQVAGKGGVPASGAAAAALNLTVANPGGVGFLTAFPTGTAMPLASSLNFSPGQTIPNRAVLALSPQGQVSFYNGSSGWVDLIVDANGWFTGASGAAAGGLYTGVTTVRLLDTRDGTGGFSAPVAAHGNLALPVAGVYGVPATGARAVVLNVTVANPQSVGFITAYPGATTTPLASDLNYLPGQATVNLVIVAVGSDGKVNFYNGSAGSTELLVDLVGWYS
jgi:spore germination protein YaaH